MRHVLEALTVRSKLWELRRNAHLSRDELERKQITKFRRLVRYAYRHSSHYRQIILKNGIAINTCLPSDFPIMTKADVMNHFDQLVTDRQISKQAITDFLAASDNPADRFLNRYHVIRSSGSSGTPGYMVYSRRDWLRGLTSGLRLQPLDKLFQPRKYAFYGATKGHYATVSAMVAGVHGAAKNDIRAYDMNDPLMVTVQELNEFEPDGIGGYTTGLKILAEKQKAGLLSIKPKWIEVCAEAMTKADKSFLQSAFGCDVYQMYGCSEHLLLGVQQPNEESMTLYDDDLIVEIREDQIVTTNLFNYTLPLIRYCTADILRLTDDLSLHGPYKKVQSLVGRMDKSAAFKNIDGDLDFITSVILEQTIPGVHRFQLRQIDDESFDFLVCLGAAPEVDEQELLPFVEKFLHNALDIKRMQNLDFNVIFVKDISVDPVTRKFSNIVACPQRKKSIEAA